MHSAHNIAKKYNELAITKFCVNGDTGTGSIHHMRANSGAELDTVLDFMYGAYPTVKIFVFDNERRQYIDLFYYEGAIEADQ